MSEEQANEKIWQAVRNNLLAEAELKEAWEQEPDHFGYATYEDYVDQRILKAMKEEVTRREADGLNLFKAPPAGD